MVKRYVKQIISAFIIFIIIFGQVSPGFQNAIASDNNDNTATQTDAVKEQDNKSSKKNSQKKKTVVAGVSCVIGEPIKSVRYDEPVVVDNTDASDSKTLYKSNNLLNSSYATNQRKEKIRILYQSSVDVKEMGHYDIEDNYCSYYAIDNAWIGACTQHDLQTTTKSSDGTFYPDARNYFDENTYNFMLKAFAYADSNAYYNQSPDSNPLKDASKGYTEDNAKRVVVAGLASSVYRNHKGECGIVNEYINWLNTVGLPDVCNPDICNPLVSKATCEGVSSSKHMVSIKPELAEKSYEYSACDETKLSGFKGWTYELVVPKYCAIEIDGKLKKPQKVGEAYSVNVTIPDSGFVTIKPYVKSTYVNQTSEFIVNSPVDTYMGGLSAYIPNEDLYQDIVGYGFIPLTNTSFNAKLSALGSLAITKKDSVASSSDLRAGFALLGPIGTSKNQIKEETVKTFIASLEIKNVIPTGHNQGESEYFFSQKNYKSVHNDIFSYVAKDTDGNYLVCTTDKNGNGEMTDIPDGRYYLVELCFADSNMRAGMFDYPQCPFRFNSSNSRYKIYNFSSAKEDTRNYEAIAYNTSLPSISLIKESLHKDITNDNIRYNFNKAEYTVYKVESKEDIKLTPEKVVGIFEIKDYDYKSSTGTGYVKEVSKNFNSGDIGTNKLTHLDYGWYCIKETYLPDNSNYLMSNKTIYKNISRNSEVPVVFKATDEEQRTSISLQKISDKINNVFCDPNYSLDGASYSIYFTKDEQFDDKQLSNFDVSKYPNVATFTIRNYQNGKDYADGYVTSINNDVKGFSLASGLNQTKLSNIPYGNYVAIEKNGPDNESYYINSNAFQINDKNKIIADEYPKFGKISLNKKSAIDGLSNLEGAIYAVYKDEISQKNVVGRFKTDKSGKGHCIFNVYNPKNVAKDDEFSKIEDDHIYLDMLPASIKGVKYYVIEETAPVGFEIDTNTYEVDLKFENCDKGVNVLSNEFPVISIQTTAMDINTSNHIGGYNKKTTITDNCRICNVITGEKYTLEAFIMDADKKAILKDSYGNEISTKKEFVADNGNMIVSQDINIDSTVLAGTNIVIFEYLYKDGKLIASEEDLNCVSQTIHFPSINTNAYEKKSKNNVVTCSDKTVICDKVSFKNLLPNLKYEIRGKIVDKKTQKAIVVDGKNVENTMTIEPNVSDGEATMSFEFDSSKLDGKTVVCFEEIYYEGVLIAVHEDINDENQTINFSTVKDIPPQKVTTETPPDDHTDVPPDTITPPEKSPKTGDDSNISSIIIIMLVVLSFIATLVCIYYKSIRNNKNTTQK